MLSINFFFIIQTIAAFFSYFWSYYEDGFTLATLLGAAVEYRTPYDDLSDERRHWFQDMCEKTTKFLGDCATAEGTYSYIMVDNYILVLY